MAKTRRRAIGQSRVPSDDVPGRDANGRIGASCAPRLLPLVQTTPVKFAEIRETRGPILASLVRRDVVDSRARSLKFDRRAEISRKKQAAVDTCRVATARAPIRSLPGSGAQNTRYYGYRRESSLSRAPVNSLYFRQSPSFSN